MSWRRLIRFEDDDGVVRFGEPVIDTADELFSALESGNLFAEAFSGLGPFELSSTRESHRHVRKLLGILTPADVPIVKCVGLNYIAHSESRCDCYYSVSNLL